MAIANSSPATRARPRISSGCGFVGRAEREGASKISAAYARVDRASIRVFSCSIRICAIAARCSASVTTRSW